MGAIAVEEETRPGVGTAELWRRWSKLRDLEAREELVRIHLPIARRMAKRYSGVAEPYDDLLQVASVGLLNAVDRFDADRGTPFMAFAKPTVMGALKRHFRDKVWTIRVPRSIHDLLAKIEKATEELELECHRPPSVADLAEHLDVEVSDILEAIEANHDRRAMSLDSPLKATGDEEASSSEWVGGEDLGYELVEERMMLESVLPVLDRREREILKLRFVDELPQSKIAERLGCSQMQVSRLLRRALERLREEG